MTVLSRIVISPDVVHGRPRIAGTRVRVTDVLDMLADGVTADEIVADYPYISQDDVRACLAYAAMQTDHAVLVAS